jgi:hypothetical protein
MDRRHSSCRDIFDMQKMRIYYVLFNQLHTNKLVEANKD